MKKRYFGKNFFAIFVQRFLMDKQYIIQIEDETPITHFFIYKDKRFPIKFDFFKKASLFFSKHQEEIKKTEIIPLVDDNKESQFDFTDETIQSFINYVHQQPISLDKDNAILLNHLANKYEVSQLIQATDKYIAANHEDLAIQILLINQKDTQFVTKAYESIISDNFSYYIKDDRLLDLNFPILYRIFDKFQSQKQKNIKNDEILNFLFKCIDKYGREASVLFQNVDFCDNKIDFLNILITKYSKKFDFHFINFEFMKTIYDQQNEILRDHLEYQRTLELSNQSMKEEIKRNKDEYKNEISSLNDEIKKMKETIEQLKESQRQQMKSEEKLLRKLEKNKKEFDEQKKSFEKLIDEQNSKITQYEKQVQELIEDENIIEIKYEKGKEFNGINNYLNQLVGGNCYDKGAINITANSCLNDPFHPKNLINYDEDDYFHSKDDILNIEICFDFKDKSVKLTNYTIKSYNCGPNCHHLRNWIIEVSNDRNHWETADERNDDSRLNDRCVVVTFPTKKLSGFYRFVRLRQTGLNWDNYKYVIFNALEFYGKLKSPK